LSAKAAHIQILTDLTLIRYLLSIPKHRSFNISNNLAHFAYAPRDLFIYYLLPLVLFCIYVMLFVRDTETDKDTDTDKKNERKIYQAANG